MSKYSGIQVAILALLSSLVLAQDAPSECTSSEWDDYLNAVRSRFYEHWKPPSYASNVTCRVLIKQNFRGEVSYVGIAKCTNDNKVHKSVSDAAYEMSPIPLPKNKECFRRDVIVKIESRLLGEDRSSEG